MKNLIIGINLIFLNFLAYSQSSTLIVELLTEKDTFYLNENLILNVRLSNPNSTNIFIPDTFNVSSNICPNGLEENTTGGNIFFNLQPISKWCQITIEELVLIESMKFIELKTNSSKTFSYDFGKHINKLLLIDCDSLGIKTDKKYTIGIEYSFYDTREKYSREKNIFTGKVKSNLIEIEICKH